MKAITNINIVLIDSVIYDGVILVDDGVIGEFGEREKIQIPEGAEIIDGGGNYAGPGLIDIHSHAGGDIWFYEDAQKAAEFHLHRGTTTILPTLYYNMTQEELLDGIETIKEASKTGAGRIIDGLYMEAPYLNPKYGADVENNRWALGIKKEEYQPLIDAAAPFAKVWCIAPEREGIERFVDDVKAKDEDAILAVAHSEASPDEIFRFIPQGLILATHHTNATGDLIKYPEVRGVCVDEAVNFSDDIYAELIVDSRGIHVDPFMIRLVLKIKGKERIILISDNCAFDGPVPEEGDYAGVTDLNFDHAGEIAGSKLSLDQACKNMMKHTGASLSDVFRYASYNPSLLLRMDNMGSIKKGNIANIVIVNDKMDVQKVMFQGEFIDN